LTAVTTNPTLGVGSTAAGTYAQLGSLVVVRARIFFGSSGVGAGSGVYRFSLPVAAAASNGVFGSGQLFDSSAGSTQLVACIADGVGTTYVNLRTNASASAVTDAVPWVWAASDQIVVVLTYDAA
jgi:hypothetical protein